MKQVTRNAERTIVKIWCVNLLEIYCSKKCSIEFTRWYNKNFYWRNIRTSILKRDNYTCQICGLRLNKRKNTIRKLRTGLSVTILYLNLTTLF